MGSGPGPSDVDRTTPRSAAEPRPPATAGARRHAVAVVVTAAAVAVAALARPPAAIGFAGLLVVFGLAERVIPLHHQPLLRPGWATDVAHFFLNNLFIVLGTALTLGATAVVIDRTLGSILDGWWRVVGHQPAPLRMLEALVVVGISRYWSHRLSHRVPWLWRFHAVHHSSTRLDWLAAVRLHPVDAVFATAATGLPLFLLGFDRTTLGPWLVVTTVGPFLDHANLRVRLPGLRWLVPNPEWHHWHHATTAASVPGPGGRREADRAVPVDRNFSPFPWVDLLFGTAYLPGRRRPGGYGIDDPIPSTGYLAQLAHPWRRSEPARGDRTRATLGG